MVAVLNFSIYSSELFDQNDIKDGLGVFSRPGESKAIVLHQSDRQSAGTKLDLKCCGGLKISRE